MSSFEKKLSHFIDEAREHQAISEADAQKLMAFAHSDEYRHKGWFSLSAALGGLGALVACFGISLIIATNWYALTDLAKISGFLALLAGTHIGGLLLSAKGYTKSAQALHFLGAGLVIAGVGLIAQIFHLYSFRGDAYLIWAVLILPLALLLRNGPIALLTLLAFVIWGNSIIAYFEPDAGATLFTFNMTVSLFVVMLGLFLKTKNSDVAPFLQIPGILAIIGWSYCLGFAHHSGYVEASSGSLMLPAMILGASLVIAFLLLISHYKDKAMRYFVLLTSLMAVPVLLVFYIHAFGIDKQDHFQYFSFGWTEKVYYIPFAISIVSWFIYFALAFWGVIYGALQQHRWMLNCNIILIGIGIFTRFLDLVGNMMDTGALFIICGVVLFIIGFILEKWRRKLIAQAQQQGGAHD